MIEQPQIGKEYLYTATGGFGKRTMRVRVIGFIRTRVVTEGVEDKRRRDVLRNTLGEIE